MKLVAWFKGFLRWILQFFSGGAVFLGMIMVGWNSVAFYYLATGRIEADMDQPPITVVTIFLVVGLILLFGGYMGANKLKTDRDEDNFS